ncbi:hypothetical protein FHS86_003885 [Roseimarinus sediminis]
MKLIKDEKAPLEAKVNDGSAASGLRFDSCSNYIT